MERIETLISKLKEQFEQNADPALLLGTVQLLQFELTKTEFGQPAKASVQQKWR